MTRVLRPFLGPGANPLRLYLRGERIAEVGIVDALRDAAADAQRRINKLETKAGIGSIVRRAQLALIRRELRAVQNDIWKEVGKSVRAAAPAVGDAAAEAEHVLQALLFQASGVREPEGLVASQKAYARRTVATFLARGENGIGLSERVYRTKQLAAGYVDRAVNRVILQGGSWQEVAKAVTPMINPDTPGGVSYAAKRLGRTELNNAFHTTQQASAEINPFVHALRWNLSGSHRHLDRCDELAREHSKDLGSGLYVPSELPRKPHPQCLCFTTNEMVDEEEFLSMVLEEDSFLDDLEKEYRAPEAQRQAAGGNVVPLRPRPPAAPPTPKAKPAPKPKTGAAALKAAPRSITDDSLGEELRTELRLYKGVGYSNTNNYLRFGSGGFLRETVENLDKAMNQSRLRSDVQVWRGIKNPRALLGDRIDGDLTGMEWIEEAPLSTSADRRVAEGKEFSKDGIIMNITVRKGAPMVKLSEMATGDQKPGQGGRFEAELLGGRGWKMRATKDYVDDSGKRVVEIEVIDHGQNGTNPWDRR